jgi:hypothetical protein
MGKMSDAFVMLEKCGLPRVRIQNITLSGVEYEIQEAFNGNSTDKNQEQRRKSHGIGQCTKAACGSCGFCATYLIGWLHELLRMALSKDSHYFFYVNLLLALMRLR